MKPVIYFDEGDSKMAEYDEGISIDLSENEALKYFIEYMDAMKAKASGTKQDEHKAVPVPHPPTMDEDTCQNNIVMLMDDKGNELGLSDDMPSDGYRPYKKPKPSKSKYLAGKAPTTRGPYRTYSLAFKLACVQYALANGRMFASKKFAIKYELIRMWCTQKQQIQNALEKPGARSKTRLTPTGVRRPSKHSKCNTDSPQATADSNQDENNTKSPFKNTHKSYPIKFKLKVVEDYIKTKNQNATARTFQIDRRQIKRWYEQRDELMKVAEDGGAELMRLGGAGSNIISPTLEVRLVSWLTEILEHIELYNTSKISHKMICEKALEYYDTDDNIKREADAAGYQTFAASYSWSLGFLKRNKFKVKKIVGEHDMPEELKMYDTCRTLGLAPMDQEDEDGEEMEMDHVKHMQYKDEEDCEPTVIHVKCVNYV